MDKLDIEILTDGTIKVTVNGQVSTANHFNAEQFIAFCANMAGGTHTSELKPEHAMHHTHDTHTHGLSQ